MILSKYQSPNTFINLKVYFSPQTFKNKIIQLYTYYLLYRPNES